MENIKNRKKVLYLITLSTAGGAQKYVFDLATGLNKEKYEVAVAAGGDGELFEKLRSTNVQIFKRRCLLRAIRPLCDLRAYFKLKKLFKEWKPDVVHLNSSKVSILGSLAARNLPIKVIYTVHGAVFEASFSWLAKKLFLWLEKWTAKYKHKIICVSEHDRQLWLKYNAAPPEKLVTIHNGIDLNIDFLPKEEARQKLFEKHLNSNNKIFALPSSVEEGKGRGGVDKIYPIQHPTLILPSSEGRKSQNFSIFEDYQIIGWLGYFYPEKNLETLINAANLIFGARSLKRDASLPKACPVLRYGGRTPIFVIIGSGPLEKNLKLQVISYNLQDKVLFLGAIPQASKYLRAFDVFTLPSIKEGLPYTILEAMAAGVPIVASDVGGIPEMIADNHNGFLIKPRDSETLAEKILQILENPDLAQQFSQNSLEKIKEFSLEKMIEQTEQQY